LVELKRRGVKVEVEQEVRIATEFATRDKSSRFEVMGPSDVNKTR
jgi:hypothetical protein